MSTALSELIRTLLDKTNVSIVLPEHLQQSLVRMTPRPVKTAQTDITQLLVPESAHLAVLERSLMEIRAAATCVLEGNILLLALLNA